MVNRPFKCKCGNWQVSIPMPDDVMCAVCAEDKHARNKQGEYDCHWGQVTASPSEVKMATLLELAQNTRTRIAAAVRSIPMAATRGAVADELTAVERAVAQLEQRAGEVPEILRWAAVKEMPGLRGEVSSRRFKSLEAVEELVSEKRRPQSDVDELKRSLKSCQAMAEEVPMLMAEVRVAIGQARQAASEWREPVKAAVVEDGPGQSEDEARKQANRERMARVRAGQSPKVAVNA